MPVHSFFDGGGFAYPLTVDMDLYRAAQQNGFKVLSGEAVTIGATSTIMFPNADPDTRTVVFSVRGNAITVSGDGGAATAGGHGNDYPVGGPVAWSFNSVELAKFRAIQNGGAATIYAEYWGIP